MKNLFYLFMAALLVISCSKKETVKKENAAAEVATLEKGQALFDQNNCMACHKPDQKIIGPSLQEIAAVYKEKQGDMVAFLKEEAPPIVDEKLYPSMKINLQLTKTLSDTELKSLELYILSHSK